MESLEDAFELERALVYGIGGGGDVVGAIPTARLLEQHGVDTVVGGIAWERPVVDPKPGPRPFGEVEGLETVSETVGLVDGSTATTDGVRFCETYVAEQVDNSVVLLDVTDGVTGLAAGIEQACSELGIDAVVGTDSGGDVLAMGDESNLRSPLADGMSTAALSRVDLDTCIGMFGYGSDGELSTDEVDDSIARLAGAGGLLGAWGLTPRHVSELETILEHVETEASRLPVEAAKGATGTQEIRGGNRDVELFPPSTVTFYVDPDAIVSLSDIPERLDGTDDVRGADRMLREAGYETELMTELKVGRTR